MYCDIATVWTALLYIVVRVVDTIKPPEVQYHLYHYYSGPLQAAVLAVVKVNIHGALLVVKWLHNCAHSKTYTTTNKTFTQPNALLCTHAYVATTVLAKIK